MLLMHSMRHKTKVLFVWPGLTGYMGDCWRELASRAGIELKVVVDLADRQYGAGFVAEEVMRGLDWSGSLPKEWSPDIAFIVGWRNALCRLAACLPALQHVPKICCFDMPWELRVRKIMARFILHSYLNKFAAAYIPGKVSRKYAKWLGFEKIYEGLFATNLNRFANLHKGNRAGFLYVGRDSVEKGTSILKAAHRLYREQGGAWDLKIVTGLSPSQIAEVYGESGAFVLASLWEPWGVVLAEAAGAGLPIICTDKCGARHEVLRDGINGKVVRANNVQELAAAMHEAESGKFNGEVGKTLAADYGCAPWADRVIKICEELVC